MHRDGKWARQILALQEPDGKWGCFHSLSQVYRSSITTEQALRRLERLGYTMEDPCIQKAVSYMEDCLTGKKTTPDPREKLHDWDLFMAMILSTWIRRFTPDNPHANAVAKQWAEVIAHAFRSGCYDHQDYLEAYLDTWHMKPSGGRFLDFVSFYQVSLLRGCLDEKTENALMDYILQKEDGIYYVYDKNMSTLPDSFESKSASAYLGAIELLTGYVHAQKKLQFVADWLLSNRNENGKWDMGPKANDKIYFPLSDDWRKAQTRETDCTERIGALLDSL